MAKSKCIVLFSTTFLLFCVSVFFLYNRNLALSSALMIFSIFLFMFTLFEMKKYPPSMFVPIAVMSAFAVVGRLAFAPFPNFKPSLAIVIITGCAFGKMSGFITGALTALVSNIFFGQGPWTLWQMLTFAIIGALSSIIYKTGILKNRAISAIYGFLCGILYGIILNFYNIIFYVKPSFSAIIASVVSSIYFDLAHSISTAIFLFVLFGGWIKKLSRVSKKFL
ncbi:MAG: ECF transporter S component [Oscillospiraceae bacterium]|nr:ECF transporter S component [Oscillospiraceae bacterium]